MYIKVYNQTVVVSDDQKYAIISQVKRSNDIDIYDTSLQRVGYKRTSYPFRHSQQYSPKIRHRAIPHCSYIVVWPMFSGTDIWDVTCLGHNDPVADCYIMREGDHVVSVPRTLIDLFKCSRLNKNISAAKQKYIFCTYVLRTLVHRDIVNVILVLACEVFRADPSYRIEV